MRSKKVTLNIPWREWEALEKLAPLLGYESAQHLLIFSPLYTFSANASHDVTVAISRMSVDAQDAKIDEIISAWERGEFTHGSYLAEVIADVVKKLRLPIPEETLTALVREAVTQRPKGTKKTRQRSLAL